MEPFTAILTLFRPGVVRPKLISASGKWAVRYPRVEVAGYGLVIAGSGHLLPQAGSPIDLLVGDVVLMPPGPGFVLASHPDAEPLDADPDLSGSVTEVRY